MSTADMTTGPAPDAATEDGMPTGVGGAVEADGRMPFLMTDLSVRRMSAERLTEETTEPLRRVVATIARTIEQEADRIGSSTETSLATGEHYWAKKITEEAYELGLAIETQSDEQVALEASQLVYRILVGVMGRGVHAAAVLAAL